MSVQFLPYTGEHHDQVVAFNQRVKAGGMPLQLPTDLVPKWLPPGECERLYQQQYVAVDDAGAVRGGYVLKHQDFKIGEQVVPIADLRIPIAESIVDRSYASVATELLFDALAKQPLLFGMGIGGYEEAVSKWFKAAGWRMFSIPFFFRINHPYRFCRRISILRRSLTKRLVLDLAAITGLAWLGTRSLQFLKSKSLNDRPASVTVEEMECFDSWADRLWEECRDEYGMIAVRDAHVLRRLYPKRDARFHRLRFSTRQGVIGWCVVLDTQMSDHKQFGSLRVGTIVDAFSGVADSAVIVRAATRFLEDRDVDLIVSNQAHALWCESFNASGYLQGPSNCLFAASRKLGKLLDKASVANDGIFLNRGDGDGPINL